MSDGVPFPSAIETGSDNEMNRTVTAAHVRTWAACAAALTVLVGLSVRHFLAAGFWSKYSGVALWSVVVYALVLFVRPRWHPLHCAIVALFISWAIEFAQLTPVPRWLASQHAGFRLVFGEHFSWWDLPAYAIGVLFAAIAHASPLFRRRTGKMANGK